MGVWEEMEREAEARGRALGLEEGRALGVEEGKAMNSESIALNFIKAGKTALEEIASLCGLTLKRVEELSRTIH